VRSFRYTSRSVFSTFFPLFCVPFSSSTMSLVIWKRSFVSRLFDLLTFWRACLVTGETGIPSRFAFFPLVSRQTVYVRKVRPSRLYVFVVFSVVFFPPSCGALVQSRTHVPARFQWQVPFPHFAHAIDCREYLSELCAPVFTAHMTVLHEGVFAFPFVFPTRVRRPRSFMQSLFLHFALSFQLSLFVVLDDGKNRAIIPPTCRGGPRPPGTSWSTPTTA